MAQSKAKKPTVSPKKGPAKKTVAKAKAATAARKTVTKGAGATKQPAKAAPKKAAKVAKKVAKTGKPAPRKVPAKVTKAVGKARTSAAPKPAAKKPAPAAKPQRRAVAASHRPQTATVSVQTRPAKGASSSSAKPVPEAGRRKAAPNGPLTEELLRSAPEADYMSEAQLQFFQDRLLQMRSEVLAREVDVKERLHQREVFADPADRASAEEEHWLDLRLRERESLLLKKIDESLRRIRDKEYGYCEKTGEPIGIARLLARPTATVCVDIKGQNERAESQYRDR